MAKRPEAHLRQILKHIDGIAAAISWHTADEMATSPVFLRSLGRAVQTIFELASELPAELRDAHPEADWRPIVRIGSLPQRASHRADSQDILETAIIHLPRLRPIIIAMLR